MSQTGLKVRFGQDVRRVTLDKDTTFASLLQTVSKLVSQPQDNLLIKYVDNEGDQVVLGCDEELAEALRTSQKNGLLDVTVIQRQLAVPAQPQAAPHHRQHHQQLHQQQNHCQFFQNLFNCGEGQAQGPAEQRGCSWAKQARCKRIFFGILIGIVAFKVFSCLASHFFCLATLILIAAGAKKFVQCRRARHAANAPGQCPWAAMCAKKDAVPPQHPVASPSTISPAAASAPSVHQPVASAPIFECPGNTAVAERAQLVSLEPKNKLIDMLQQLEDMGFSDKQRNIAILVEHNFSLAQAISTLVRGN